MPGVLSLAVSGHAGESPQPGCLMSRPSRRWSHDPDSAMTKDGLGGLRASRRADRNGSTAAVSRADRPTEYTRSYAVLSARYHLWRQARTAPTTQQCCCMAGAARPARRVPDSGWTAHGRSASATGVV